MFDRHNHTHVCPCAAKIERLERTIQGLTTEIVALKEAVSGLGGAEAQALLKQLREVRKGIEQDVASVPKDPS